MCSHYVTCEKGASCGTGHINAVGQDEVKKGQMYLHPVFSTETGNVLCCSDSSFIFLRCF